MMPPKTSFIFSGHLVAIIFLTYNISEAKTIKYNPMAINRYLRPILDKMKISKKPETSCPLVSCKRENVEGVNCNPNSTKRNFLAIKDVTNIKYMIHLKPSAAFCDHIDIA